MDLLIARRDERRRVTFGAKSGAASLPAPLEGERQRDREWKERVPPFCTNLQRVRQQAQGSFNLKKVHTIVHIKQLSNDSLTIVASTLTGNPVCYIQLLPKARLFIPPHQYLLRLSSRRLCR
jgi:hypothetical protein